MNLIVFIMLLFSLLGFIDKMFQLNIGLSDAFDKGLKTMGTMSISLIGICSVGVAFISQHINFFTHISSSLPIDASLIISALLAPDMGGYSISEQLASQSELIIFNGVILTSLLGQTMSFQFPVFLSAIDSKEHSTLIKGFIFGIIMIPFGLIIAQICLQLSLSLFLSQFIPIFIICMIIAGGLLLFPKQLIKGFTLFACGIQWLTYVLFLIAVIGVFFPTIAYAPIDLVKDSILIVLKSTIIVCGSLVLSELILKYLHPVLLKISKWLHINEISVMGLILSCATSLAILPLFSKMDHKGKLLNAAFAVSGAYFIGGQLGYIATVTTSSAVTVYILSKIVCGLMSICIMSLIFEKTKNKSF